MLHLHRILASALEERVPHVHVSWRLSPAGADLTSAADSSTACRCTSSASTTLAGSSDDDAFPAGEEPPASQRGWLHLEGVATVVAEGEVTGLLLRAHHFRLTAARGPQGAPEGKGGRGEGGGHGGERGGVREDGLDVVADGGDDRHGLAAGVVHVRREPALTDLPRAAAAPTQPSSQRAPVGSAPGVGCLAASEFRSLESATKGQRLPLTALFGGDEAAAQLPNAPLSAYVAAIEQMAVQPPIASYRLREAHSHSPHSLSQDRPHSRDHSAPGEGPDERPFARGGDESSIDAARGVVSSQLSNRGSTDQHSLDQSVGRMDRPLDDDVSTTTPGTVTDFPGLMASRVAEDKGAEVQQDDDGELEDGEEGGAESVLG